MCVFGRVRDTKRRVRFRERVCVRERERECERDSEMNGQEQLPTFCLRIFAERRVVGEKSIFICLHIVGSCVVKSNKKEIYFHLNNLNEKQCKQKLFWLLVEGRSRKTLL